MSIAGVVLAAGASTRLGAPKQLIVDAHGETLVHRAARQLLEAGCAPVFVVVGAEGDRVAGALDTLPVVTVDNAQWEEGVASSIRSAVAAAYAHQQTTGVERGDVHSSDERVSVDAPDTAIDALLLTTCDMPTVGIAHLRALSAAYISGAVRVASRYVTPDGGETLGIPAIVGAREWPLLEALHGDRGAKPLFYEEGTTSVSLVGGSFDIDRPADVQALQDF
jgi:molybdenum cofactor cytidylyltransferase